MADTNEGVRLKSRLETCFTILNEYSWLLDSYVLDFFIENHVERLSESWKNFMNSIPLEEFYYLMNLSVNTQTVWPLSIISLRVLIRFLQLPRMLNSIENNLIISNKTDITRISDLNKIKSSSIKHPKLRNYFFKHVKPKKQDEIFKMAMTTAELANELNVKYIVDVGSGLGHLSRLMAYGFNLEVCLIETQSQLLNQAELINGEFEKISHKYLNEAEFRLLKSKTPVYLNQKITFDLPASDFVKNVKEVFSVTENDFTFGIVGLHPCGDLAAVLLKLYANCSEVKFINLVGCCYHKLSSSSHSEHEIGFPLSNYGANKCFNLSYEARALACHAIETYGDRLKSKNYSHLRIHCYRAALENIIDKNYPEYRKSSLGNVKSAPQLSFSEYCQLALKKLNLTLTEEDLHSEKTQKNLSKWEAVAKFYSLRLMLAPLIETVILLDRNMYLLERGFKCGILPAFDPEISPRNQLLISWKNA